MVTKTSEVVSLLSNDTDINNRITVTGGSTTEIAQTGSLQFTGGGLGFTIGSTVTDVVAAINNHSTAAGLITASGSGSTILSPLPRTVLRGGEPTILSTASDVVALLSGHSVVTATGSGSAILSPLDRTYLSSTLSKTTYTWNAQDRLTGVTTPDGTRHGYTYDYRARRVQTSRRNGPLPAQTTTLVFSGGLSLAEYESSTSGAITANTPTVHYLRGPDMGGGVGGMLYSIRGSTLKYSLSNGRGDIVAQSDESAAITWTASYEAFGKRPAETGTNLDKQRANSKDEDPTGLLNEGFRYRDLETGAFISRDPAGFVDGPNLYAYVKQNPWSKFDPLGLAEDRVDPDGFKWSNNDHHIVPREVGRDAGWNKEAKEVFDRAKLPTPNGHGNTSHPKYNQEVAAEMADFVKKQGVTDIGSAKNQKELAERFVEYLSKTDNPYIKGFNGAVSEGPAGVKSWYNTAGKNIILKSTGKVAAEGGAIVNGIASIGAKSGRLVARGVPIVGGVVVGGLALMGGASTAEASAEVVANSTIVGGFALDASHLRACYELLRRGS